MSQFISYYIIIMLLIEIKILDSIISFKANIIEKLQQLIRVQHQLGDNESNDLKICQEK